MEGHRSGAMKVKENTLPDFPCTSCGACCRQIGNWVSKAKKVLAEGGGNAQTREIAAFPHAIGKFGVCSKLGSDNRCTIYETRPDVCNVKAMWAKHSTQTFTGHCIGNAEYCNQMIKREGLPKEAMVNMGQFNRQEWGDADKIKNKI
jgi:hypothetical protein